MPKYSVVTPLFNSFDLMERYFETLKNQTYKDFEIIIVDDCSSDDSFEKVLRYAESSVLNIKVLKTEKNLGPGNARNIGMDAAKGEWITFIDNDDWVELNLFERADKIIEENNVNCVIYDYYIQKDDNKSISRSMYFGEQGIVSLNDCIYAVRNHTIGKFYKLSILKNKEIKYPILRRCEDVAFVVRAVEACGSVYYLNEPLYYYYQRPSSLSNNSKLDETDMLNAFAVLEDALRDKYPNEIKEKSVCDLLYGVILMMCKAGKSNKDIKNYIKNYEKKYAKWSDCRIIQYLGKSKKIFLKAVDIKCVIALKILAWVHSKLIT